MTTFTFYIGGKLITVGGGWLYAGGSVVKETFDVDKVSFFTILDKCGELGYKNIRKLWYDAYCAGLGLMKNLKVLDGDSTFGGFINYALENKAVNLYVEHGDGMHPYFDDLNPISMCNKLGIDDHGHRVVGGSSKGKSVVVDDSHDSEFDGYQTEQRESEYECDDIGDQENEPTLEEYWVDCPYLSVDEEEEFRRCRVRRKRFNKRGEKKKTKKKKKREVRESMEGPIDDVGLSGGGNQEGNARVTINSGGNGDDIVDEIRREMSKRGKAKITREEAVEENNPENQVDAAAQGNVAGPAQENVAGPEQGHGTGPAQGHVGGSENTRKRRKTLCTFCKIEGHRRDVCVLNPASRRFGNPSSSQVQTQASQVSASEFQPSQVQTSQVSDRTQLLLQELRQSCGTALPSKGRKKKSKQKKGKIPGGYGCFVAESGWTCYDPKTPRQRVIDVPERRNTRSQDRAGTSGQ